MKKAWKTILIIALCILIPLGALAVYLPTGQPNLPGQPLAELYSQALVGMVALVGQWWLERRSPSKEEVAAHLVDLAYHGLAHLRPSRSRHGPAGGGG